MVTKVCPICGKEFEVYPYREKTAKYCSKKCQNKDKDLTGKKFGRWTVLKQVEDYIFPNGEHRKQWLCKCECGTERIVLGKILRNGQSKSCGCWRNEKAKKDSTTHGMSHSRLYNIYSNMKDRCYNKKTSSYKRYGGRGIKICQEWLDDFENFKNWALPNGYNDSLTIDRINNNGNYEPSNCRWITSKEQQSNTRRNLYITYNGEVHTLAEWERIMGVKTGLLGKRLRKGWDIKKAFTTPSDFQKVKITFNGITLCSTDWDKKLGFRKTTVWWRIKHGWSIEKALTTPIKKRQNKEINNDKIC